MTPLAITAAVLGALALGAIAFFVLAVRMRVPWAHRWFRTLNRIGANRYQLRTAGQAGARYAVLHHRGRTTGLDRATPLGAVPVDGGFEIVLPYGRETDWLKNLRAAGRATLEHDGTAHEVALDAFLPLAEAASLSPSDRSSLRWIGTTEVVRLRVRPS